MSHGFERIARILAGATTGRLIEVERAEEIRVEADALLRETPDADPDLILRRLSPIPAPQLDALLRLDAFRQERARARRLVAEAAASGAADAELAGLALDAQRGEYLTTGRARSIREYLLALEALDEGAYEALAARISDLPIGPEPATAEEFPLILFPEDLGAATPSPDEADGGASAPTGTDEVSGAPGEARASADDPPIDLTVRVDVLSEGARRTEESATVATLCPACGAGFRLPLSAQYHPGSCPFCAFRFFIRAGKGDLIIDGGSGKRARGACDACRVRAWLRREPGSAACPLCKRGTIRLDTALPVEAARPAPEAAPAPRTDRVPPAERAPVARAEVPVPPRPEPPDSPAPRATQIAHDRVARAWRGGFLRGSVSSFAIVLPIAWIVSGLASAPPAPTTADARAVRASSSGPLAPETSLTPRAASIVPVDASAAGAGLDRSRHPLAPASERADEKGADAALLERRARTADSLPVGDASAGDVSVATPAPPRDPAGTTSSVGAPSVAGAGDAAGLERGDPGKDENPRASAGALRPPSDDARILGTDELDRLLGAPGQAGTEARRVVMTRANAAIAALDAEANRSLASSIALAAVLDKHRRLLLSAPETASQAKAALAAHARRLADAASGPATLREARACADRESLPDIVAGLDARLRELTAPPGDAAQAALRESARQRRDHARAESERFLARQFEQSRADLDGLVTWMEATRFGPAAAVRAVAGAVRGLAPAGDPGGQSLLARLDALAEAATQDPPAAATKEFGDRMRRLREKHATPLLKAVDACLGASEPGIGFDLFRVLLSIDPDLRRAHVGLGHVKVDDEWLRPYDAAQRKAGLAWSTERGWVVRSAAERYATGDHFDVADGRWAPIADLERLHASVGHPWTIETEHFVVKSTASLALTAKLATRLEAFFLQVFRQYDLVFAAKDDEGGARLVFGVAPQSRKLDVHFYRDEAQFRASASPPTRWAAGFYDTGRAASFFYATGGDFHVDVVQHEIVHQILGEMVGRGSPPCWLVEGAAVALESAEFDESGTLVLGDIESRRRIREYRDGLREGDGEHSLRACLAFRTSAQWDSGDIARNYRGVGALIYFLLSFDRGRYRGDTLDMIRDAYRGGAQPIGSYFSLTEESLERLMDRFYRGP